MQCTQAHYTCSNSIVLLLRESDIICSLGLHTYRRYDKHWQLGITLADKGLFNTLLHAFSNDYCLHLLFKALLNVYSLFKIISQYVSNRLNNNQESNYKVPLNKTYEVSHLKQLSFDS